MADRCSKCGSTNGSRIGRGRTNTTGVVAFFAFVIVAFAGSFLTPFLIPLWFVVAISGVACLALFRSKVEVCVDCGKPFV